MGKGTFKVSNLVNTMSEGIICIDSDSFSTIETALTYVAREIEKSNMLKTVELLQSRYKSFDELLKDHPSAEFCICFNS